MMFAIFLSLVAASSASLMQYPNYNPTAYNSPHYNYPSYVRPSNHLNYPAPSLIRPQPPIGKGPLCGFLNGVWKTFPNIQQFKQETRQCFEWIFYGYGPCPVHTNPTPNQPYCAIYNNELRTFADPFSLEVENILTGAHWVKLYPGACSNIPTAVTSTTVAPMTTTPSSSRSNGAVCGILNGFRKTFSNINEFNAAKSYGWSFYCHGPCPISEICAKFNNEFKMFPNAVALEVENYVSGKNWIIQFSGECPITPSTPTTATSATTMAIMTTNPVSASVDDTTDSVADTTISTTTDASRILPVSVDNTVESITETPVAVTETTDTTSEVTPLATTMTPVDDSSDSVAPESTASDSISITTPTSTSTYSTSYYSPPPSYRGRNKSSRTNRIRQNNSFHGPYVEGAYNYYSKYSDRNNSKAFYDFLY